MWHGDPPGWFFQNREKGADLCGSEPHGEAHGAGGCAACMLEDENSAMDQRAQYLGYARGAGLGGAGCA